MNKVLKDKGKPYSFDADVEKVQKILENSGFNIGKYGVDGKYGKDTAKAVKAYQKTYGLKIDGIVGDETWGHMTAKKNTDDDILKAQKLLNFLGYKAGAEDAIYGPKTTSAVKKFQKQMRIAVDGILGAETWRELKHMDKRFKAWKFDNVKQFQIATSIKPDSVAGKATRALLDGTPIVPRKMYDLTCQCVPAGKKYCNGRIGLSKTAFDNRTWGVRVLNERILREVEKKYPNAGNTFYVPSVATPSKTGSKAGGARCAKWNKERGGASGSCHLKGVALDVYSNTSTYRTEYQRCARNINKYGGVGSYSSGTAHICACGKKHRW